MYAPGSEPTEGLVKNKKAKPITFKKLNGRISLYMGDKKVGGGRLVNNRLGEMKMEIDHATKGHTVTTMKDFGPGGANFKRHGIKSTFPKWFGEHGFKSKKDFRKVLSKKKGIRHDRLVNQAIKDLSKGYDTLHGQVPASKKFQVKTRQKFDNKGVVFRRIRGRVVPMRPRKPLMDDEVPF